MQRFILMLLVGISFVVVLSSCSNSRHLAEGEFLYVGSDVHISDDGVGKKRKKVLAADLEGLVRPKPNRKTLGIRWRLSLYNLAGEPRKKHGLRNWLRNKVGEPPVLASSVQLNTKKALMTNFLENKGFFHGKASAKFSYTKKKKATAVFEVHTGKEYLINEVYLMNDSSEICRDIAKDFKDTYLKSGGGYNLDVIKAERFRIERLLKEEGYYFFSPDYLLVVADSSIGQHKVNMYVRLKRDEMPAKASRKYYINDIYIYPDYKLRSSQKDTAKRDMVSIKGYNIIDPHYSFKPSVFVQPMAFKKGDKYSLDDQNASLSRLVNMGNFKFVKNRVEPIDDSLLNIYYYLTQNPRKSFRFEVGALTQNDNRVGTRGSVSWRHRNAFRGAEEFSFKLSGGFEGQYTGPVRQPNIYNIGSEVGIAFPRFVVPFIHIDVPGRYLPRSVIKLKYSFESSAKLINISSYTAAYGYNWKETPQKEHQLYPFNFTYVNTDTVGSPGSLGLLYGNQIFNGIILGPTYDFTYNSQGNGSSRLHSFYFNGRIDLSGNIMGLSQQANYESNPQTLFGATYAQYVKLQSDFRHYLRISGATTLASRVLAGVGMPNGNSSALPNVKQFWGGGNSDLRGFPSRLLGPGTFNEYDTASTKTYIQTLGDIKLEGNVELRQRIYNFLHAGLFVDVGNIWQYRSNPDFPGGKFTSDFYKQLAVELGVGLRFDFSILLLRFDLGIPVRKPWLSEGQRWVVRDIDFSDKDWRRKNMILNIAIGYPF